MMAGCGAYFGGALAPTAAWTARSYSASSGHGGVAQYFVHNDGGAPSAGAVAVPDSGSGVYGGMDRPISFTGYGSGGGAAMSMAAPARLPLRARANGPVFKAPWTEEEDEILTEAVRDHANEHRKWAAIAQYLPGRTGKQCRERWVNHVDPGITKTVWTEADDMELIEAHQRMGNCWSAIAKMLSGRSENSVKNHWNATRRGLKAKRTLKKRNSEQPPPGQPSLLAKYIFSLCPAIDWPPAVLPAAPAPPTEPDHQNQQLGLAAAPLAYAAPAMSGMYYHQSPANVQHSWAPEMNAAGGYTYYLPPYPKLNHRQPYGMPPTPGQMINAQDLQAAAAYASMNDMYPLAEQQRNLQAAAEYASMDDMYPLAEQQRNLQAAAAYASMKDMYPLAEQQRNLQAAAAYASMNDMYPLAEQQRNLQADQAEIDRGPFTNNNMDNAAAGGGANDWCYFGDAASGSGGDPDDDDDVVQMASREFGGLDQYMAALDQLMITRFD